MRLMFENLKRRPRWLAMFLILAAVSVGIDMIDHPLVRKSVVDHLPASASRAERIAAAAWLDEEAPREQVFLPVRLLAGWLVFAGFLFSLCRIVGSREPFTFRQIWSLEVHSEAFILLGKIVTAAFALSTGEWRFFRGSPIGLAVLAGQAEFPLSGVLGSINLFNFLYAGALAAGLTVMCRFSAGKAIVVAGAAWGTAEAVNIAILGALGQVMHLPL